MNKYLINVIVPSIEMEFDVYIPNNKKVGTIKKYILESIKELSENSYDKMLNEVRFCDRDTGKDYDNNLMVKDTDIKNGTKLIII